MAFFGAATKLYLHYIALYYIRLIMMFYQLHGHFLNVNLYNFCFDYNIVCFVNVHFVLVVVFCLCVYVV